MITLDTAARLDTLAQAFSTATGPDPNLDSQYYSILSELTQTIDGRVMATGFKYSLNVTCALNGRPRHWDLRGINEFNLKNPGVSNTAPTNCGLVFTPDTTFGVAAGVVANGTTIGLATCSAVCRAWASIIRMWVMHNYPLAVTQYKGPAPV